MKKIYTFLILFTINISAQYVDLNFNIPWSAGTGGVADIEAAFENGRIQENVQLNPDISTDLIMPSQVDWDAKSPSEKALFLLNAERAARGLLTSFEGVHSSVVNVAQTYAEFLRDNDLFNHNANNSTPTTRLSPVSCADGASYGENLSTFVQSNGTVPLPVERSVYNWIYNDAGSSWGHRQTCFATFNDNHSANGSEGFIGIGIDAVGPPYSAEGLLCTNDPPHPPCNPWDVGVVVVLNFVDPCPSSPLPVELTSFTLNLSENKIELNWETATEVNNYGFEIERLKTNLIIKNSEWEKIGFVEGHGNSNSPKYYSFKDNLLETSGKYSYRLKQIDIDGTFEYSDVVETNIGAPQNFELRQNYPNPFNPVTSITYSIPTDGHVELGIYDILGRDVAIIENGIKPAGVYTFSFDASNLTSGIYFYKIKTNNYISIKKMLLMK
ncbi:MAG: T9SS type A sorting domain-containing protein [Ignavibacteriae bacterium]|nr:T9SS type A sorting domain-containing protein [Ignavibacteriota bacterium]